MNVIRQLARIPEYATKLASIPAGVLAFGSEGGTIEKAVSGIEKMASVQPDKIQGWGEAYRSLNEFGRDYLGESGMTPNQFLGKYSSGALNTILDKTKNLVDYLEQASVNLQEQPVETVLASVGTAGLFYGISKAIKFYRQKGQGSVLDKMGRKMGNKIWSL